jgi:hypothetical protein
MTKVEDRARTFEELNVFSSSILCIFGHFQYTVSLEI